MTKTQPRRHADSDLAHLETALHRNKGLRTCHHPCDAGPSEESLFLGQHVTVVCKVPFRLSLREQRGRKEAGSWGLVEGEKTGGQALGQRACCVFWNLREIRCSASIINTGNFFFLSKEAFKNMDHVPWGFM